jgi:hypothetical protein
MIGPNLAVQLFDERPRVCITTWHRIVCSVFGSLVRFWRRRAKETAERKLPLILREAAKANTRNDLENILGKPRYALVGSGGEVSDNEGGTMVPDRIEVYLRHGCTFDVWFFNEALRSIYGFVRISVWDVAVDED